MCSAVYILYHKHPHLCGGRRNPAPCLASSVLWYQTWPGQHQIYSRPNNSPSCLAPHSSECAGAAREHSVRTFHAFLCADNTARTPTLPSWHWHLATARIPAYISTCGYLKHYDASMPLCCDFKLP